MSSGAKTEEAGSKCEARSHCLGKLNGPGGMNGANDTLWQDSRCFAGQLTNTLRDRFSVLMIGEHSFEKVMSHTGQGPRDSSRTVRSIGHL